LSSPTTQRRSLTAGSGRRSVPARNLNPDENNVWPTSESQPQASANIGPGY